MHVPSQPESAVPPAHMMTTVLIAMSGTAAGGGQEAAGRPALSGEGSIRGRGGQAGGMRWLLPGSPRRSAQA